MSRQAHGEAYSLRTPRLRPRRIAVGSARHLLVAGDRRARAAVGGFMLFQGGVAAVVAALAAAAIVTHRLRSSYGLVAQEYAGGGDALRFQPRAAQALRWPGSASLPSPSSTRCWPSLA